MGQMLFVTHEFLLKISPYSKKEKTKQYLLLYISFRKDNKKPIQD